MSSYYKKGSLYRVSKHAVNVYAAAQGCFRGDVFPNTEVHVCSMNPCMNPLRVRLVSVPTSGLFLGTGEVYQTRGPGKYLEVVDQKGAKLWVRKSDLTKVR